MIVGFVALIIGMLLCGASGKMYSNVKNEVAAFEKTVIISTTIGLFLIGWYFIHQALTIFSELNK